jgi:hypothetical protein
MELMDYEENWIPWRLIGGVLDIFHGDVFAFDPFLCMKSPWGLTCVHLECST